MHSTAGPTGPDVSRPGALSPNCYQAALLAQEASASISGGTKRLPNVSLVHGLSNGHQSDPSFYIIYIYYLHVNNEKATH